MGKQSNEALNRVQAQGMLTKNQALKKAAALKPAPLKATTQRVAPPAPPAIVAPAAPKPRGRQSIIASTPPEALKGEINALLAELKKSIDGEDKKRIRRALRSRGHRGGLNEPTKAQTVKATETVNIVRVA